MNYFWTSYHFHVTINVFSGPIFSPLSHVWLLNFLDRIQRLTIEVDLTRMGSSAVRLAATFGHKNDKVEKLIQGLFQNLLERPDRLTMAELNLMCRRYGGYRTLDEIPDCTGGCRPFLTLVTFIANGNIVSYCPDDETHIIEMMPKLRGILQRCRISGFPSDYTKLMLSAIFGDGLQEPNFIVPSDSAWPPVPVPVVEPLAITSYLPAMRVPVGLSGTLPIRRHFSDEIASSVFPTLSLTLHHSRSFSDEMEDEITRYGSLFDFDKTVAGESPKESHHNVNVLSTEEQRGSNIRASIISDGTSLGSPVDASTPRESLVFGEILCTRTFSLSESHRSLSPPRSPETLNKLNERDPAFIRAVPSKRSSRTSTSSIASHCTTNNENIVTMIESPALRSTSSMSARTDGSIKRRYTSLMDKLRGRANT